MSVVERSGEDVWKSAGLRLVERDARGWLAVTPDYLRAYLTRPEIHPIEESCPQEHALFERLMADPYAPISDAERREIADADTRENYRLLLAFRDRLAAAGAVEGAYLSLFAERRPGGVPVPPMFIDQMVHLIAANILSGERDAFRWRAGELLFREQTVSASEERILLADAEIVEMRSEAGFGSLGALLAQAGTPMREVTLDVLTEENAESYFARADRYDMAIDMRFTQAAPDALGRVIEAWMEHFLALRTRVEAVRSIRDERWSWHIGLSAPATRMLNALYAGEDAGGEMLALYRVEILDQDRLRTSMRDKPVYLGLAADENGKLVMKPQNLVTSMPLQEA